MADHHVRATHPLLAMGRALTLTPGEAVVMGSTPLWLRGLLTRPITDLDLLACGSTWARLAEQVTPTPATSGCGNTLSLTIEVADCWPGMNTTTLLHRAVTYAGLPVASLADALTAKRLMGRDKDHADLAQIATG